MSNSYKTVKYFLSFVLILCGILLFATIASANSVSPTSYTSGTDIISVTKTTAYGWLSYNLDGSLANGNNDPTFDLTDDVNAFTNAAASDADFHILIMDQTRFESATCAGGGSHTYSGCIGEVGGTLILDQLVTFSEEAPTSTQATAATSTVFNPNQEMANALFLFTAWFFGVYWIFSKKR